MKETDDRVEKEDAMDEDQQDEEDSDDDLDIILEADDDDYSVDEQQPSSQKSLDVSNEPTRTDDGLVNIKLGQQGKDSSQSNDAASKSSITATGKKSSGGVDLDNVGEYNGQPITDVDLDIFEDKPWRKPGADITDYFNFGFNEMSWKAYCAKQKNMRDKKGTGKDDMAMPDFMTGMGEMPDFMKMGMMMPMMDGDMPMGMMEGGGMPMGMMNPMMNQMMGMPPPPPQSSSTHRHQQMNAPMMNGPPMGGPNRSGPPSMGGAPPMMGGSSMGNSSSSRSSGNSSERGGQGNQNYGGASGHGHSYTRGQRR
ncbi:unnamed protein product [Absidia cylindrospora]